MTSVTKHTRLSPEQRKSQLLTLALGVFAKRGIGRGCHAEIAEVAQVSVATVFNYFQTREDLVRSVLVEVESHFAQFLSDCIDPEASIWGNLENLSDQLIELALADSEWVKIWFEWSTSTRDDVWPLFLEINEPQQTFIVELFKNAIQHGEIESKHNPEHITVLFHGLFYSLFVQSHRIKDKALVKELAADFLSMMAIHKKTQA